MLEDLFITDAPGANIGSDIELSERIEDWPMEIQNVIISQVPMLMDIPGELNFNSVDQDKMYAKGSYIVDLGDSPEDSLIFPIIVKSGKLLPVDLYIHKGRWHPLDLQEVNAILTSPDMGEGLMSSEDVPPMVYNALSGRITPPAGYGSGVVSSVATKMSALNRSISDELIGKVAQSLSIKGKLAKNSVAAKRFSTILDASPESIKTASNLDGKSVFGLDSIIYSVGNGEFSIKQAKLNDDKTIATNYLTCDGDQLATWMKEASLDIPRIIKELKTRKMAFTWDDSASSKEPDEYIKVKTPGRYTCYKQASIEPVKANVIGKVATLTGDKYLSINDDESYSLQSAIVGKPTKENMAKTAHINRHISTVKVGSTVTVPVDADVSDSPMSVTIPAKVASIVNTEPASPKGYTTIVANHSTGKYAFILSNDKRIEYPIKTAHIPEGQMIPKYAEVWYLPANYPIIQLPAKKQDLIKSASDVASSAYLKNSGRESSVKISMWNIDKYNTGIKIGSAAPQIISRSDAMLLMKRAEGSGVLDGMSKIASGTIKVLDLVHGDAGEPSYVAAKDKSILKTKKDKEGSKIKSLKMSSLQPSLLKVAAVMEDEEDVDTVLALNYITPENMMEFKNILPDMKSTEEALAKLLMSVRLGNPVSSEQDVKNTLEALHNIISEIETGL